MKGKRLTIILIVFSIFVLVICLTSALFMLKTVEVNFISFSSTIFDSQSIINSGGFEYGKNVFLLSKSKYIENLELNNPYLKVINLETIFPNKVRINCTQRVGLFCVNVGQNYYIFDYDFKLLEIVKQHNKSDFIEIKDIEISSLEVGQVCYEIMNNYKQIAFCLKEWSNDESFLKMNINSLKIENNKLIINMENQKDIIIKDYQYLLSDKMNVGFSAFSSNLIGDYEYIYIYTNSDDQIICVAGNYD